MLAEIHAGELLTRLTAEYDKLAERLDLLRTQYENHPHLESNDRRTTSPAT